MNFILVNERPDGYFCRRSRSIYNNKPPRSAYYCRQDADEIWDIDTVHMGSDILSYSQLIIKREL